MSALTPTAARAILRHDHVAHIHPSITAQRVTEAVERQLTSLDNPSRRKPGSCLVCGTEAEACEPDAAQYECESCSTCAVYGTEEILIAIA